MIATEKLTRSSNRRERTAKITQKTLELGFDKVGIVRADELLPERERLEQWLARGYHGEMSYMARDPARRANPRNIFPEAKSVVVVAFNYYTPQQHDVSVNRVNRGDEVSTACGSGRASVRTASGSDRIERSPYSGTSHVSESNRDSTGKVSRYAWGGDYHEVLGDKLRALLGWIKAQWPEAEGKVCVDIQPMIDKAWGLRAGLGWMGKHTNLITNEYGSWVFRGELLLNLELEYDQQEIADQCGSCTLCIDACPTGAIVEPYVLDSNLCISHATIESRAPEIREDVASRLEGWLYGCDICQDVCPWNHTTPSTNESRFQPRDGNVDAKLSNILALTPESYALRFRGSAMKRAKLSGLQRNAHALLNAGSADASSATSQNENCTP